MNPQLEGLHEITLPEPVSWMPQTPAWFVLIALLAALAGWAVHRFLRRRRANLYRKAALEELNRMTGPEEIPELVKRVALRLGPREDVASLIGNAWLQFLDHSYGGSGFAHGPGQILSVLAYGSKEAVAGVSPEQVSELTALVRTWIHRHHATDR